MKKSRLFITLLVMLFAASGYAQDSYRQAVKEYLAMNGQVNQLASALKQTSMLLFESGDLDLNQLTERYVEERLMDQMTDMILPKVKAIGVSEKSLEETISLLSTSAGKLYKGHEQQWTEALRGELTSIMLQNLPKVMAGDTSDPIQPKAGIDAKYINKYKKVLGTQLVKSFMQMIDQKSSSIVGKLPDGMKEGLEAWMTANLPTIAMNSAYGILTEDDLDFASKLYSNDTYNKLQGITPINGDEMASFGVDFMTNYVEWMQAQGAMVKDGAIDMLKQLFGN